MSERTTPARCVYHLVPANLAGSVLYPLNRLKENFPEIDAALLSASDTVIWEYPQRERARGDFTIEEDEVLPFASSLLDNYSEVGEGTRRYYASVQPGQPRSLGTLAKEPRSRLVLVQEGSSGAVRQLRPTCDGSIGLS